MLRSLPARIIRRSNIRYVHSGRIIDYKIVKVDSEQDRYLSNPKCITYFEKQINDLIKEGFEPHGGPSIASFNTNWFHMVQAMIKREN